MRPDLHDELLRIQLQQQIEKAFQTKDLRLMREVAEMLADSYVNSRVAAKHLALKGVGTLSNNSDTAE
ncbi:hypothetical protein SynSYN20_01681 [Synechococcus sp. SYN20]|uniref:hypothetical protein n=1 Tax=Synechococcus sp. SYN20 TaxID=1050714 RepID=UPI0016447EF0|nr:hypothetical protein [Synechococcus sp. SYN20]QNJ26008.1 hypothetical protein SynSYN20_01681 [Synechococcus sp. SYN20]